MSEIYKPVGMTGAIFNCVDVEKFALAMKMLNESLGPHSQTLFCADNIITWNRNLSFLRDPFFLEIIADDNNSSIEKSIIWRTYILLYFAEMACNQDGDLMELGCHTGYTAFQVLKKLKLNGKAYWLYDVFERKEGDAHTLLDGHSNPYMYENVLARFHEFSNVKIIKGKIPDSLDGNIPEKICFAHIDLNNAEPEAAAIKIIIPRLVRGGYVIFDDYGWYGYSEQKRAIDPIVESFGLKVLELPTGQGLLIKS